MLKSLPGQHPLDIGVQRGEEGRWLYPRLIEDNRPPLEYVLDSKKANKISSTNLIHSILSLKNLKILSFLSCHDVPFQSLLYLISYGDDEILRPGPGLEVGMRYLSAYRHRNFPD